MFGDAPVFDEDEAFDDYPVFRDPEAPAAAAAFHGAGADGLDDRDIAGRGGAADVTDATGFEPGPHATPAAWSADDTLPPDVAGGGERRGLRERITGSGRQAVLAGAAALFVAIVVVSSVLALGSGDNGKSGRKVSDPSAPPAPSELVPSTSAPETSREPTRQAPVTPSYSPPEYTGTPSGGPPPTGGGTPTDTPTGPTSPPPDDSPTDDPDDPPTDDPDDPPTDDPEDPPTDPEPPGDGT